MVDQYMEELERQVRGKIAGKQPVGGKPIEGGSSNPSSHVSNPVATFVLLVDFKSVGSIVCGWL